MGNLQEIPRLPRDIQDFRGVMRGNVKPKCRVGVDFTVHGGGPWRVSWESGSLLGLHS